MVVVEDQADLHVHRPTVADFPRGARKRPSAPMPNMVQFAFLGSFVFTFLSLAFIARTVNNALLSRGYDISRLILLGLNTTDDSDMPSSTSSQLNALKSIDLPYFGQTDVLALVNSPAFAFTLAFLTLGAIFARFAPKG